jgi:hypothetical protein
MRSAAWDMKARLDFSDGFAQIVTDSLHAPDGDGIEHYPGFL